MKDQELLERIRIDPRVMVGMSRITLIHPTRNHVNSSPLG